MTFKGTFVLLSMLVLIPIAIASTCSITFGQTAPFTGTGWQPGNAFNLGLLSAFHEANSKEGGVKGCQLKVVSMDDQYNTTKTVQNMNALLAAHPDLIAFIALMGSPPTTAGLPVAAAAERLIIGPLTGSSVFRKKFNPWTINLRAGYDDEVVSMLRLLVTVKKYRRISIIYQNDAFGAPARAAIGLAMAEMKLELASSHTYDFFETSTYDYAQFAKDVWAHKPQAIVLFTVAAFCDPFLTEFYKLDPQLTQEVTMVIGSWIGDSPQQYFKANPALDPTHFHTTSVVPHPEDESLNSTKRYRQAVRDYLAATSPSTTPTYDFLGMEGYLAGRAAIEALKRAAQPLTPDTLRRSFYDTKMFGFEELLAGPFSDDCVYDPGTAVGRSALCTCNQGFRFVEMTVLTKDHRYATVGEPLLYPTTECFATTTLLQRPIVFGALFQNTSKHLRDAAALLELGVRLETAITGSLTDLSVQPGSTATSNSQDASATALSQLESYGQDYLLLGGVGGMALRKEKGASTFEYAMFQSIFGPAHLADETFDERSLFMTATLQQEMFAVAGYLQSVREAQEARGESYGERVALVLSASLSAERNDVGLSVRKALENSLVSNGFAEDGSINAETTFDASEYRGADDEAAAAAKFAALLREARSQAGGSDSSVVNVFLYGIDLDGNGMMDGLLEFLKDAAVNVRVFMSFSELGTVFGHVQEQHCPLNATRQVAVCDGATAAALRKLHMATHLPMWTASFSNISAALASGESTAAYSGTFAFHLQSAVLTSKSGTVTRGHLYNPLVAMGFWLSEIAHFLLVRTRGDASTAAVVEELYRSSVVAIDGIVLGPFVNKECAGSESCLCNFGARTVDVFAVGDLFDTVERSIEDAKPVYEHRFQRCHVTYTLPTWSLSTAQLAGIIAGSAVACMVLMLSPAMYTKIKAMRRVAAAPKDASQPYTLVFTDIQSSTSLWARLPEQMGGALDAHHELIRQLIEQHNGYEVKTIGDAFMIAFKDADDAVELCMRLQEEFYRFDWAEKAGAPHLDRTYKTLEMEMMEDDGPESKRAPTLRLPDSLYQKLWNGLRVRCGIHTGLGDIKYEEVAHGYDYYGNVANIAARTEAVGNGGQVCMTKATVTALSRCSKVKMTSLGGVELRGVPEPVEIFQLDDLRLGGDGMSSRTYAPLRLDKALEEREGVDDNTGDDSGVTESENQSVMTGESGSRISDATGVQSMQSRQWTGDNCNFRDAVVTLFSTMDMDSKTTMLRKIAAKWRLKLPKKKKAASSKKSASDSESGNESQQTSSKEERKKEEFNELVSLLNRKLLGVFNSRKKKDEQRPGLNRYPSTSFDTTSALMMDQRVLQLRSQSEAPPSLIGIPGAVPRSPFVKDRSSVSVGSPKLAGADGSTNVPMLMLSSVSENGGPGLYSAPENVIGASVGDSQMLMSAFSTSSSKYLVGGN